MRVHTFILICAIASAKGERTINSHSDPSKAPEICAADGSNGVQVAHENCNKFYICDDGIPKVIKCYQNLNYNPNGEYCDWPSNVECGDRIISENGDGDDPGSASGTVKDDPSQAPGICAAKDSEGTRIAHENCNQYYKCSGGLPVAYTCQGHLFYDPSREYCDCADFVNCGDRNMPGSEDNEDNESNDVGAGGNDSGNGDNGSSGTGNGTCNCNPSEAPKICAKEESDGVLVAHEKCNKFYKCTQSKPIPIRCPSGLLFNPMNDVCDWPENVECGDRIIPDPNENGGSGDNGNGDNDNDSSSSDNDSTDNGNNGAGNCDPSEAPKICASERSEGVLVAHEKCNKFYKCSLGKPVPMRCPGGLLFNPAKDVCDWPENVECGDRLIPDSNENGGSGDNGDGDHDNNSDSGENDSTDNGTGDDGNNGAGNCDPSEAPKICASEESEGVLVAHEKCNKFYKCSIGKPIPIRCPGGLLFNPMKDVCDWPENVECGDRIIPDPNENGGSSDNGDGDDDNDSSSGDNDNTDNGNNGAGNCDPSEAPKICASEESEGVLVAHEKCNKFYKCSIGKPIPIRCPGGFLFNPMKDVCDWPENVECGDRIIPDPNENGGSGDNGDGDDDNDSSSGDNDNTDNGNNGAGNCDPSEAPKICASEESEGVLVAHEKCNKFYKCSLGKPIPIRCPGGLLFNPMKDVCDWPENVECGDRIIPDPNENGGSGDNGDGDNDNDSSSGDNDSTDNGNNGAGNCDPSEAPKICASDESEGVLVAHEKCNKFYKCSIGKPIPIRCPGGLLFNPAKDVCDWPENVKCGDRIIPDPNENGGSSDNGDGDDDNDSSSGDNDSTDNGNGDNGNNGAGNCDPSEAPKICASDESEGVLVAHEKCNKFYKCSRGKPIPIRCPGGLLFNPMKDVCDWPENVECGDRIIPDPNENGGSGDNGDGDDDNDSSSGDNDNDSSSGDNDSTDNGNGDNGNNGAGNCDPSEAPKICASDESEGVLVAHEKCNKFYKCSIGKPIPIRCPGGLLFNPMKDVCDWPENVVCGDRLIPDPNENGGSGDNVDGDDDNDGSSSDNDSNDNGNNGAGNCDPSEAPNICASDESKGVLVAHEKCNKFYKCSLGKPIPIRCPGGLLFNPMKDVCDWSENVECGDRIIPDSNENGGSGDNEDGDHDNNSSSGENDSTDNGTGDGGNNGAGNCDPSEAPKICAAEESEGVLVAHEKCNKFYKCSIGKPIPIRCPGGLLFNPMKDVCDWPENVECGHRIIPDPNENGGSGDNGDGDDDNDSSSGDNDNTDNANNGAGNCDPSEAPKICASEESEGVLVAHEKCNKFYKCSLGKPIPIRCPGGLLFNPAKDVCDWPENVECGDRIIPDPNENESSGDNGNGDNDNDSSNGDNDSTDNGNGDNGNNGAGNCDPSEAPKICASDESEGVLVAHEKCNKFYKCSKGKPIPIRCPGGLLFNPMKDVCDWPENVECGDRIIPDPNENEGSGDNGNGDSNDDSSSGDNDSTDNGNGDNGNIGAGNCDPSEAPKICASDESEGVLVAHEKCNKFYKCSIGKPIPIRCPGGLLFNPMKDVCDWPENVDCGDRIIPDSNENGSSGDNGNGGNNNDCSSEDNNNTGNGNGNNGNGNGTCNCNPSEAPKICASNKSEGVLVAHEKCNKFYKCSLGIPIAISCPGGLLFNPMKDVCDWPENVECGDRIIPDTNENGGSGDNGDGDNDNDSSSGDNDSTDNGNIGAGNCDPNEAPKICASEESEGVLVAHEKCNKFYTCSLGKPIPIRCPGGLLFNPMKDICDWPENVDCEDRTIPDSNENGGSGDNGNGENSNGSSSNDNNNNDNGNGDNGNNGNGTCNCNPREAPAICATAGSEGVLVAHDNCNQFHVCYEGKPVVLECPLNLLYNPRIQACDWPENVKCANRAIPGGDSDNGNIGTESSDNDNGSDDSDTNNGGNDYSSDARTICAAPGSDGVYVPHGNCNQFYLCIEFRPAVQTCPANLLYDIAYKECDWPQNVDCADRFIPSSLSTSLNKHLESRKALKH